MVPQHLISERLASHRDAAFLLDNGLELVLWVGAGVSMEWCAGVLGKPAGFASLEQGKQVIPRGSFDLQSPVGRSVHSLLQSISQSRPGQIQHHGFVWWVIREDAPEPALKAKFLGQLVEDRTDSYHSYAQFLMMLKEKMSS